MASIPEVRTPANVVHMAALGQDSLIGNNDYGYSYTYTPVKIPAQCGMIGCILASFAIHNGVLRYLLPNTYTEASHQGLMAAIVTIQGLMAVNRFQAPETSSELTVADCFPPETIAFLQRPETTGGRFSLMAAGRFPLVSNGCLQRIASILLQCCVLKANRLQLIRFPTATNNLPSVVSLQFVSVFSCRCFLTARPVIPSGQELQAQKAAHRFPPGNRKYPAVLPLPHSPIASLQETLMAVDRFPPGTHKSYAQAS
ncbi:hypothetical protein GGX14DRAFT_392180 [Mycena pura]|uniref:Uncharacterized protein n=1 Tax=Mycena pura TaxID=153505 RepID=A0AAD6VJH2_9AGAR|nr:hypothetical protein GGX14DRAFT_392180 [Mycena pura]